MLTEQRKQFVEELLKRRCRSQKEAAIAAGYSPKSAETQASQILKDPQVHEYFEQRKAELAQEMRQEFLFDALEARKVMYAILKNNAAEDRDRLNAAKDFLDRAGFKAPEKMELHGELTTGQRKLDDILGQLRGDGGG